MTNSWLSLHVYIVATISVEPSVLVLLAFISKSANNQCYNPYIFGKISKRSFQKYMGFSIDCLHFTDFEIIAKNTNTVQLLSWRLYHLNKIFNFFTYRVTHFW